MTSGRVTDATSDLREESFEEQFATFFEEVHGWEPFPWQRSLLRRVLAQGWPALIDVPTGLGKTAVLDIAVFVSAMRSQHGRHRVFLVVDRRLIVDQAHEHATRLQRALDDAPVGTICHAVRRRLAADGDDGPPLDVTRMRGGVNWSWLWLERPDRHALVTGTVDQIGSRLLFRGYGVGELLRPIDAALVGTDSLIIVDEAHLSDPFLSTLRDIQGLEHVPVGRAPVMVAMSASPGRSDMDTHRIGPDDEQHPVAGKRLRAPKRFHPVAVPAAKGRADRVVADALAYWGLRLGGPGKVTGIVANTVAMARAVFSRLHAELGDQGECVLLTGRIRPTDREYLQHAWYPRIRAGANHPDNEALYLVATQTIEVGADIDLDGLVTESASLPALIQRLGRVNRRGDRAGTAVILHAGGPPDTVYGTARQETWQWLTETTAAVRHHGRLSLSGLGPGADASPVGLRHRVRGIPAARRDAMSGVRPYAPLAAVAALDTWARTSPQPSPDVPVGPYLHGIGADQPTVSLIWRADVHGEDPMTWRRSVDRMPPTSDEAIELPIAAARQWLASLPPAVMPGERRASTAGEAEADRPPVSDSDTAAPGIAWPDLDAVTPSGNGRRFLRYRGTGDIEAITYREIRPNDLLIVPAKWGGCDHYGWNPDSAEVTDVADLTGGGPRGHGAAVRIDGTLIAALRMVAPDLTEPVGELISRIRADISEDTPDEAAYREALRQIVATPSPGRRVDGDLPHERVLRSLASNGRLTILDEGVAGDGVVGLLTGRSAAWNDDGSSGGTSASANARHMTLAAHQAAVRYRAGQFARNLGLPGPVIWAVEFAAAHHDEGKRDPRFQVMLHRGDRWLAQASRELLAKSGMDPADRAAFRLARELSRYPASMRHEALSARIAAILLATGLPAEIDKELVLHLVASHHGFGRPLLPPVEDPAPVDVDISLDGTPTVQLNTAETVDWEGPQRFAELCDQYGRWGLALLEAVVRLADIWCSARAEESS